MHCRFRVYLLLAVILTMASVLPSDLALGAQGSVDCSGFNPKADRSMQEWTAPASGACEAKTKTVDGVTYPIPDPACTPGAVNPTLTLAMLRRARFRTGCERNKATSASTKNKTYDWYAIQHPTNNIGPHQICELDHLISIEIGGADTLDNIWPQCGPKGVALRKRFFKQKDNVENYLAAQVRAGTMNLGDVQAGVAKDWTQYLKAASTYYRAHRKRSDGG